MLTPTEIRELVAELEPAVLGAAVERLSHPSPDHYIFHLARERSGAALRLVVHPRWPRLCLTRLDKKRPADRPGELVEHLRRELVGRWIAAVTAREGDRYVVLSFEKRDLTPPIELHAELFRPAPNLVLVGADGRVLALHRSVSGRRPLKPGERYLPPPPPPPDRSQPPSLYGVRPTGESWSRWIDARGRQLEEEDDRETLRRRARQRLERELHKQERKRDKLLVEAAATESSERVRQRGELLLANLHRLKRGLESITVEDYYTGAGEITIELDSAATPQQNAERYFRQARKLETGRDRILAHLAETEERIAALERQLEDLESMSDPDRLEELAGAKASAPRTKAKSADSEESQPRRFTSRDGWSILVGRNDRQNHEMTIRRARGNDLWLHVDQATGSHVVVPVPKGQQPPPETLLDAAQLALYYSKVRGAKRQPVVYTRRKFIKHPKGAPLGRVTFSQEKRLEIGEDAERLRRLVGKDRFDA